MALFTIFFTPDRFLYREIELGNTLVNSRPKILVFCPKKLVSYRGFPITSSTYPQGIIRISNQDFRLIRLPVIITELILFQVISYKLIFVMVQISYGRRILNAKTINRVGDFLRGPIQFALLLGRLASLENPTSQG